MKNAVVNKLQIFTMILGLSTSFTEASEQEGGGTTELLFVWSQEGGLELAADLNYVAAAAGQPKDEALRRLRIPRPVRWLGRCLDVFDYLTVPYGYYACVEEEKAELDRCLRVVGQVQNNCTKLARLRHRQDPRRNNIQEEFKKCSEQMRKDTDACFTDYYASITACSAEFVVDMAPFEAQFPGEIIAWSCEHPEFF